MKALILAAGYAVRLYPLTWDQPKSLLLMKNKTILEHIIEKIEPIPEIDEVFIVTNSRFYSHFLHWLQNHSFTKRITLIDDGTTTNENRLGAVGDIQFFLDKQGINTHCMVIAGDNLFGFSLQTFIDFFHQKQKTVTAFYDFKDKDKIRGRYGVGVLHHTKILDFEEKPIHPKSTLAATACYIIHQKDLPLVQKSIVEGKIDNLGDFMKYVLLHSQAHGFVFEEYWFDVGSVESLQAAEEVYSK